MLGEQCLSTVLSKIFGSSSLIDLKVTFYVLLGNEPARISIDRSNSLVELFMNLQEHPRTSRLIPTKAMSSNSIFYRLKNPVLFSQPVLQNGDVFLHQAKSKCKEVENRECVEPLSTTVRLLAQSFSPEYAYLVVEFPDRKCSGFQLDMLMTPLPFSICGAHQGNQEFERE